MIVTAEEGATGDARDAAKHPMLPRTAPIIRSDPVPNVSSTEDEKPCPTQFSAQLFFSSEKTFDTLFRTHLFSSSNPTHSLCFYPAQQCLELGYIVMFFVSHPHLNVNFLRGGALSGLPHKVFREMPGT